MGGRGSSGFSIPQTKKVPGVPRNAITEDEFLALRGVGSPTSGYTIDKLRGNRQLRTQRGVERFQREVEAANKTHQQSRTAAREEYHRLVSSGAIRDKTTVERLLTAAHGSADNQSTQAARRSLEKRGIDWRNGKRKKK